MKVKILRAKIKKISQEDASLLQYNLLLNKKIITASLNQGEGNAFFVYLPEAEKELKQKISNVVESIEEEREEDYETIIARRFLPEITNQTKPIQERLKLSNRKNP